MKLLAILAVGLFATLNANARLGWTLDQCRQKYGTEKKERDGTLDTPVYIFETTYFQINARLVNDKVAAIEYIAKEDSSYLLLPPFYFYTQDVINEIVRKNVGDQELIQRARPHEYDTKDGTYVYTDPPDYYIYNKENRRPIIIFSSSEARKVYQLMGSQKAALSAREITAGL